MATQPVSILMVEDDPLFTKALRQGLLDAADSEFELCDSGTVAEAQAQLKRRRVDAILLDLSLPDCQGIETFTRIHADAPTTPIIVLTGSDDDATALAAMREGAQDYLVKRQVNPRMLAQIIRYAIERKRVEEALREREEFFRLISESMTDLIAVIDRHGKRLYNSPSYRAILGDPEALIGKDSFAEIHPEDREHIQEVFQQTLQTGIGQRAEYRFLLKNGMVRHVESQGSVINDASGEVSKVVVISRDITERREAEERLRASEALYHSLVESLPQNILRKDDRGRFIFVNQNFCAVLGKRPPEVLGKTDFDFFPPELARKYQADDRQVMESGKILETVEEHQAPGQEKTYVQVVKIPIYDATGKCTGIQGIFWDITDRIQAEARLRQTNEDLSRSQKALLRALADVRKSHDELKNAHLQLIQAEKMDSVGALAAGVAHEVKNPLQTILMGVRFLSKAITAPDENIQMVLADMRTAVGRADAIVKGLLEFSAPRELSLSSEDINVIIEQSLRMVNYDLTDQRIEVVRELMSNLPPLRLDKTKMEQVFINLFMNAIHAMQGGGTLTLRTQIRWLQRGEIDRPEETEESDSYRTGQMVVSAEIEDTGHGIPEEKLVKIFDPFFTTKPVGQGTGLGLTVVKKIVEMNGGMINIGNRPQGGVRVSIVFNPGRRNPS